MATPIESLPPEIKTRLFHYLSHDSLTQLTRINRTFHLEVEPLLWTKIELHRPGYHEYYQYDEEFDFSDNLKSHRKRPYHPLNLESYYDADDYYQQDEAYRQKAFHFMKLFEQATSPLIQKPQELARYIALANKVRFLCLTYDFYHDDHDIDGSWSVFTLFVNLEHLELTVHWPYDVRRWDRSLALFNGNAYTPLAKVHTLHLRGYIPAEVTRYLCYHASNIKDLELALLDRPIGRILCHDRKNPPPGYDQTSSSEDDEDGADIDISSSASSEDFDHEEITPRALAALHDTNLINKFTSLTHLNLTRPAESAMYDSRDSFSDVYVSTHSEHRILQEWKELIRASRPFLKHLVLDQRPFAEFIETDSTGDKEFLETYPYGPGYRRFVEHVLPILLEDVEWPKLESIRLYGFDVPTSVEQPKRHPRVYRERRRIEETLHGKVEARFAPLGINVRSGLGRRMLYEDEDGVVRIGDGVGGERIDLD